MEITYSVRKTLTPLLMNWVNQSRIREHIIPGSFFISFLDDTLYFYLSNLSVHYRTKHVMPNLPAYSLSLFSQLIPAIRSWCIENNIQHLEFQLRFSCEDQRYDIARTVTIKKDDKEYAAYLGNKST